MPTPTLRYLFLLLALGWAFLIYHLSSLPGTAVPPLFFAQDKLFHFIAFSVLGFLAMGTVKAASEEHRRWRMWLVAAAVVAYGVLDEVHQHFVPGRVADIHDILADAAGGIFGVWVMFLLSSRITASRQ